MNMKFIKQVINYVDSLVIERRIAYSMTTNAMLLDKQMDFSQNITFICLLVWMVIVRDKVIVWTTLDETLLAGYFGT